MKSRIFAVVLMLCCGTGLSFAKQPATAKKPAQASAPQKVAAPSPAAIDPAKDAAIRRLLEAQGTKGSMKQVLAGMTDNMKPLLESSLPAGTYRTQLIELFLARFQSKLSVDQLLELAIPVYDKHFSIEEIDGLTKFFQTPLGKKTASVLPQVVLETQSAGTKLGEQIGRQAMLEVLAEHPDLQKALEEASSPKNP